MKNSLLVVPLVILLAACGGGGGGAPAPGASSLPPITTTQAATSVTTSGAVLNGSVNPNGMTTDVWFDYGLNPLLVGATSTTRQAIGSGVAAVSVNYSASGFASGTTYYYRVCASSTAGTVLGTITSCTTGSPGSAPTVTTIAASGVGTDNAGISGSVNPNNQATNGWFEWGTSSSLASYFSTSTQSAGSGSSSVILNDTLSSLSSGTPYYYRVAATNATGTSRGSIATFTTSLPSIPPTVTTLGATNIGVDNATVNGQVNPNGLATTAYFEWGLDNLLVGAASTAGQSIGSGSSAVAVNAALPGLTDNATYYYRVVGTNSAGTSRGVIGSFTTVADIATITINNIRNGNSAVIFCNNVEVHNFYNNTGADASTSYVGPAGSANKYRFAYVLGTYIAATRPLSMVDANLNNKFQVAAGEQLTINPAGIPAVNGRMICNFSGSGFTPSYQAPVNVSGAPAWTVTTVATGSNYPVTSPSIVAATYSQTENLVTFADPSLGTVYGTMNGDLLYFWAYAWNGYEVIAYRETVTVNAAGNYFLGDVRIDLTGTSRWVTGTVTGTR